MTAHVFSRSRFRRRGNKYGKVGKLGSTVIGNMPRRQGATRKLEDVMGLCEEGSEVYDDGTQSFACVRREADRFKFLAHTKGWTPRRTGC